MPDDPKRLAYEVKMMLSSVASHGPAALTTTDDPMYTANLLSRLRNAVEHGERELRDRELHHFEAEKALTDLLALSWGITRDSHCSHLGADIRFLIPADVLGAHSSDPHPDEENT